MSNFSQHATHTHTGGHSIRAGGRACLTLYSFSSPSSTRQSVQPQQTTMFFRSTTTLLPLALLLACITTYIAVDAFVAPSPILRKPRQNYAGLKHTSFPSSLPPASSSFDPTTRCYSTPPTTNNQQSPSSPPPTWPPKGFRPFTSLRESGVDASHLLDIHQDAFNNNQTPTSQFFAGFRLREYDEEDGLNKRSIMGALQFTYVFCMHARARVCVYVFSDTANWLVEQKNNIIL